MSISNNTPDERFVDTRFASQVSVQSVGLDITIVFSQGRPLIHPPEGAGTNAAHGQDIDTDEMVVVPQVAVTMPLGTGKDLQAMLGDLMAHLESQLGPIKTPNSLFRERKAAAAK